MLLSQNCFFSLNAFSIATESKKRILASLVYLLNTIIKTNGFKSFFEIDSFFFDNLIKKLINRIKKRKKMS